MKTTSKFSGRLNELMFQTENITAEELGANLGIAPSTIRCWKNGSRSISLSFAIKLADFFKCSLDFLCGRSDIMLDFTIYTAQPFYQSLMLYMKKNSISRYRVVKETKLSNGNFDSWRKGSDPKIQTVIDLCDYLEISIDQLIGRER